MLSQLPKVTDPNLLVGTETGDDAAVYRLRDDLALVQTVDFFPPVVDDPYRFGAVAAANALSDIYAMGGTPLLGLNIVAYPIDLPKEFLVLILQGGYDKAAEAGLLIVGGHTIDDKEPKYGLAVTGLLRPGDQVTNAGAQEGDLLVLTKPIGTGIITTAGKQDEVDKEVLEGALESMEMLNRGASAAMLHAGVHACTDVTGFGLLGHLHGMALGSGVGAEVRLSQVPLLPGTWELAQRGIAPGGTHRNLKSLIPHVRWDPSLPEEAKVVLSDAQTSGGLLIAVAPEREQQLMDQMTGHAVSGAVVIGRVIKETPGVIHVLP